MNATLQCLINTDILTRFLLTEKIYMSIVNNIKLYELTSCYSELLLNVCCCNKTNFRPTEFKKLISRKNPLFKGVRANDSKDLISFLLEEMNEELKNLEIYPINNNDNDKIFSIQPDETNKLEMLNYFKNSIKKNNKSIISKIFYILIENGTICKKCKIKTYNYQVTFYLHFPLKSVYEYCFKNNIKVEKGKNNIICIPLLACFKQYCQSINLEGDNRILCKNCNSKEEATYINNIYF